MTLWYSALSTVLFICSITAQDEATASIRPAIFVTGEGSGLRNFSCTLSASAQISTINFLDGTTQLTTTRINDTGFISIDSVSENNNTEFICQIVILGESTIPVRLSPPALFLVQGVLSPPLDLEIVNVNSRLRSLSWNPPFTLDITDQDPDISNYRVCFNLSSDAQDCTVTTMPLYRFLNIRLSLHFFVTAINIVGESAESNVLHQACDSDTEQDIINTLVSIKVKATSTYSISVTIQQPPGITCYDAYSIKVTNSMDSFVFVFGPLLPVLTESSAQIVQLEEVGELQRNRIYTAQIIAVNINGERMFDEIAFSTYDVQAVMLSSPQIGKLDISCTFIETSLAIGCEVTICQESDNFDRCRNAIISRNSSIVLDVEIGTYTITNVSVIEVAGIISPISNISRLGDVLEASIKLDAAVTTQAIGSTVETGGLTPGNRPAPSTVTIIGAIVGVVLAASLLLVPLLVACIILWKKKRNRSATENKDQIVESMIKEDESVQSAQVMMTQVDVNDHTLSFGRGDHCPTSTLTDINHESSPDPPDLPPKKNRSSQHSLNAGHYEPSSVIPPPPEFSASEPTQKLHQFPQVSGNATYAELEHHRHRNIKTTNKKNPDKAKANVLYSEIKIPPVPPQKKSPDMSVETNSMQYSQKTNI